jgi:hypothetical protein
LCHRLSSLRGAVEQKVFVSLAEDHKFDCRRPSFRCSQPGSIGSRRVAWAH